jgi:8-oxo-dGTP diphosphatase
MTVVRTRILPAGSIEESMLFYVVIGAREAGNWIFVRHADRVTWEMPAGHIEPGEAADRAAERELFEETGTTRASLEHLCDYEVDSGERKEYGRLYRAEVLRRTDRLEHEIAEVMLSGELPENLTYPEVQSALFHYFCSLEQNS